MYPGQKKSAMTWVSQIFLGVCTLIFIGAIAFGIFVAQNGGIPDFGGKVGKSDNPLESVR